MSAVFRIRELRQNAGITQAQLAEKMNLKSASAIAMWESGDRSPASDVLPKLAEVLGCTIDELYIQGQDSRSSA